MRRKRLTGRGELRNRIHKAMERIKSHVWFRKFILSKRLGRLIYVLAVAAELTDWYIILFIGYGITVVDDVCMGICLVLLLLLAVRSMAGTMLFPDLEKPDVPEQEEKESKGT